MTAQLQTVTTKASDSPRSASKLLTATEVAELVGVSVETLAQWRSQRRGIPFVKIARNIVRYRAEDLDAFVRERIVRVEQDLSNARRNN